MNGLLIGDSNRHTICAQSDVTIDTISVARLDNLWQQQMKADFPECKEPVVLMVEQQLQH